MSERDSCLMQTKVSLAKPQYMHVCLILYNQNLQVHG